MAVTLLRRAQTQISRSTDTAGNLNTSLAAARQLLWLEDHERSLRVTDARRAAAPARLRSGIVLDELRFAYPGSPDQTVLGPLSLELPAGQAIALVGHNGAGKTTLVKLLSGMYRPSDGRILIDGVDLAQVDLAEWRGRVSAAFQDFVRFQLRLRESVGVGDLAQIDDPDLVRAALARAGSGKLESELPDGLETHIGNRYTAGRELSGGTVAAARPGPRPDAAGTAAGRARRADREPRPADGSGAVRALRPQPPASSAPPTARSRCSVSHRFSTVRTADLIVVLEDGQVVESGSHEQLVAAGGQYAELFELQARAYA